MLQQKKGEFHSVPFFPFLHTSFKKYKNDINSIPLQCNRSTGCPCSNEQHFSIDSLELLNSHEYAFIAQPLQCELMSHRLLMQFL